MEYVRACVCVCVCVWERERERERDRLAETERDGEDTEGHLQSDLESMDMGAIVLMLQYWKIKIQIF